MIDTLLIVCHLAVNITITTPAAPADSCAFERHRVQMQAASREAMAAATEYYRKEIEELTKPDDLTDEILRIFSKEPHGELNTRNPNHNTNIVK